MRSLSIFGATGSVGESAFDLLTRAGGPDAYRTVALTGGRNVARLAEMARALQAEVAVIADETLLDDLRSVLAGTSTRAAAGEAAIDEAARMPSDWSLSAIVGTAGLMPGLRVVERGGTLALANKESLVAAGPMLMGRARASGATILPVDSEHSAIFQCLEDGKLDHVEMVTLTASGGAFRDWPVERLVHATVAEASSHPNWSMGQRITIDSASMFNKALEVIEAHEFFALPNDRIRVLVHPESIVHAMVTYADGATLAHMGPPDMRHAIGHALHWPHRARLPVAALDLAALGSLTFRAPDEERWPALRLAREVVDQGGAAGAVLNAAKEQALDDFMAGRIRFTDMAAAVEHALDIGAGRPHFGDSPGTLDAVLDWDRAARRDAADWAARNRR